jgi:hypothetical protein
MDSIDGGTRLRTKEFAHLRTLHQGAHTEHRHFIGNRERLPNRRPHNENRHRAAQLVLDGHRGRIGGQQDCARLILPSPASNTAIGRRTAITPAHPDPGRKAGHCLA